MKKFFAIAALVFGVVSSSNAQMVVDAEQFKANPAQFMGKVVTIKNVVLQGSQAQPGAPTGTVSSTPTGTSSSAPVGLAGPSSGPAKSAYCNPNPNTTLTKWTLGPNNTICTHVDAKMKPALDRCQTGSVAKSISFRVTPTMYMITRIEP